MKGLKQFALRDICRFLHGATPAKAHAEYWGGLIPWFSPKDMKTFELLDSADHTSEAAIDAGATQILNPGALLVVVRSGILAHSFPVGLLKQRAAFNQDIKALVPDCERIIPEYLGLWLRSRGREIVAEGVKKGPTVHSIKSGYLETLLISVPAMDEQRRIAARLKEQLAAVEAARAAVERQEIESRQLTHALVRDSLRQRATRCVRVGDLLCEVKAGVGKDWQRHLLLGATRDGLAPAKEPVGKAPERYKPCDVGTIFYNPMRVMIGSIAMIDEDDQPGITSPDYVVVAGRRNKLDTRWFYYWLRSPLGERFIASLARGAVRERMLFNRLAEGEIELPDFDIQERSSAALKQVRFIRMAIEKKKKEIGQIATRLLAEAFA